MTTSTLTPTPTPNTTTTTPPNQTPAPIKKTVKKKDFDSLDLLFTYAGKDKIKVYTLCTENICRIFEGHETFYKRIRYDEFKNRIEVRMGDVSDGGEQGGKWEEIKDNDVIKFANEVASTFSFFQKITKTMMHDVVSSVAMNHRYDSAKNYIRAQKWDGEERLSSWLSKVYGVEEDEYHQKVGGNWIKGLVKRIINPGCKFDYILVIEGPQGCKKSTSLSILGGDWYTETFMNTDNKDFFMQFHGKAIIEFSEGETLSRTDVKRMKAIITTATDRFRPPYMRNSEDYPRRCVFAMTTNESEYLKDETGNRRWLPVTVQKAEADVDWLKENRDQIFAEAYHRVETLKETVWEFPKEETIRQQEARVEENPNQEKVEDWYFNTLKEGDRAMGITTLQIYTDVIYSGFPSSPMKKYDEMWIAGILRVMGLEKRRTMERNMRKWRWFNPKGEVESTLKISGYQFTDKEF